MTSIKPSHHLAGKFVRIEPLEPRHLNDLENGFDPSLFDYYPKPYSTARDFFEENFEMEKSGSFVPFAIVLTSTSEAIGCTEFSSIDLKNRKLEIGGSWLKRYYHGTAANSEAKLLLLQYVFENVEFVRVQFTANTLNSLSRSALEKIGARFEGILRNVMILPDGKLRNDAYYSIIASEWPTVKSLIQERVQSKLKSL